MVGTGVTCPLGGRLKCFLVLYIYIDGASVGVIGDNNGRLTR